MEGTTESAASTSSTSSGTSETSTAPQTAANTGVSETSATESTGNSTSTPEVSSAAPKGPVTLQDSDLVTVIVDGQEQQMPWSKVRRIQQKEAWSHKLADEARTEKAKIQKLAQALKADPRAGLEELGVDPYEWAENLLLKKIEEEKLRESNPSELKYRQAQAKLEQLEAEREQMMQQDQQREQEQYTQQQTDSLQKAFLGALETSKLAKTPAAVAALARALMPYHGMDVDFTNPEWIQEGMDAYHDDIRGYFHGTGPQAFVQTLAPVAPAMFGELDGQTIFGLLGEKALDTLRRWDVARVKQQGAQGQQVKQPAAQKTPEQKRGYMTPDEHRQRYSVDPTECIGEFD